MGALTMKYRGGWLRLVHRLADYVRDSGTTTMCPCWIKARHAMRALHPPIWSRGLDSVQTTREKAAFDNKDNLDGQSDKQGNTRIDRVAIYGRSYDQK